MKKNLSILLAVLLIFSLALAGCKTAEQQEAVQQKMTAFVETAKEAEETVEETVSEVVEAVEDKVEEVKDVVEETVSDVTEAAQDAADTVEEKVEEVAETVEETVSDVTEAAQDTAEAVEEKAEEVAEAVAETSGEKVTVTWWHTFTEGQKATLEEIIAEFNATHDGIEVVAESQPLDGFESKVYEAVSNGTGPDIIFGYASSMPEYVDNGLAPDLLPLLSTDYKSRVSAGIYAEDTAFSDNGLHAIAVQTTGPIFFYNKTIFDELGLECPKTWDDITEASKKIYEAKGIPGFAFDSLTDGFQTLLLQKGGEYVDVENKKVLFNTPEFEAIVAWYAEGVQAGYFGLAPTTGNYFSNDMGAKALASYVGSSAGLPYLNLGDDELAAAPMPKTEGGVDWVPGWNRSALIFASNEAQEKAAVEFIEFFTTPENAAKWAMSLVAFTPYNDAAELPEFKEFLSGNIALTALGEQLDYAYVLPAFTGANTVRNEIKFLVQKAASGQMSAAEAIAEAVVNCEEAMND